MAVIGLIVAIAVAVWVSPLVAIAVLIVAIAVSSVQFRRWGRTTDDLIRATLPTRPADERGDADLVNLAGGLSAVSGVPLPTLAVLDEPGANLMVFGAGIGNATVVVTSGLLTALDRIQLEAMLARAFVQLRQGGVDAATLAVAARRSPVIRALTGVGSRALVSPDREVLIDRAAVGLTRYPPALIAALRVCEAVGTVVSSAQSDSAHLWMADPLAAGDRSEERASLRYRIDALELL